METDHYIVGIGASAGGMEALHDLFDYMPADTGFSFIIVQHLSPDYKSLLTELLTRHTRMKVVEAENGMAVEPDCIYAIPTKNFLTIKNSRLFLSEKLKTAAPNNAIDVLFESLATDQNKKSVGIILSGTGTDGTRGIGAIKKAGGIVIVQEPLTAAFDGMPNSAIATGTADIIVPPEMIGEELVEFAKQAPLVKSLNSLVEQDEGVLHNIIELLHKQTKLDFANYKRPTLFRRLAKRMSEVGINSISEYEQYLRQDNGELNALAKEFLINVTKFFRDIEAFEALRMQVIPAVISNRKADDPIKVWIAACSSGEEAYSITILFLEYMEKIGQPTGQLKVFATDIDNEALEIGSRGIYPDSITKDIPPDLLMKYFIREGNLYRIAPELRKHIVFANHDLLKDPPFSSLSLITCRNMFIYISAALQQKVLRKFHFALKIDSFLMLGPSENISILKDSTEEINRKWKIYRCINKAGLRDANTFMMPIEAGRIFANNSKQALNTRNVMNHMGEIFKETMLEDRKIAAVFVDKELNVRQAIGAYKHFLQFPQEVFNFNILKLLIGDLAVALGVSLRKAIKDDERVVMENIAIHKEGGEILKTVNITVKPYLRQNEYQQSFLCVVLEEQIVHPTKSTRSLADHSPAEQERIGELELELISLRENLQAVIEEMETANEELQSNNEEMISTNEELQSTNEELQSLNEELHTVSGEHQLKIKELLELNDDLNNYFNNSEIGQVLVDRNLVIRKFSPAITNMINVIESDIGRSIVDITTNFKELDLVASIKNVIQTGQAIERELVAGEKYYFLRITPYIKRDRTLDGAVVNFTDITDSKKLSSIITSVFNSSSNGITAKQAIRNKDNKIIDFQYLATNTAARKIFGVNGKTLEGKTMMEVFPAGVREYMNVYAKVVETGEGSSFEFYNEKMDRWYNVSVVKMLDGVVTTHTDVTEKRKAADVIAQSFENLKVTTEQLKDSNIQLERSNFDLHQFASIASHDLKEPLRKIQAFGNILKGKIIEKLNDDERNYFNKMISSSERMQILIEDVLSLSKLSNSALVKSDIDLEQVIKGILDDLEISIKEKNAVVEFGKLPKVKAVSGQMRQLFQNLISNGLKFRDKLKPNPKIEISQKTISAKEAKELGIKGQDFVCISVKDNGIGFEDEYKEKIFGIFQRLHGRNYEGTGIGLAIARKIIENHSGYILAEGKLNEGAEFLIFLPTNDV